MKGFDIEEYRIAVAIRFRWIWAGREIRYTLINSSGVSQSAFAGYGLEELSDQACWPLRRHSRNPLSLDMGWKSLLNGFHQKVTDGRNPLSLDMGWKSLWVDEAGPAQVLSQSAFAGYGLEEPDYEKHYRSPRRTSQSAFAGYGLEEPQRLPLRLAM